MGRREVNERSTDGQQLSSHRSGIGWMEADLVVCDGEALGSSVLAIQVGGVNGAEPGGKNEYIAKMSEGWLCRLDVTYSGSETFV